MAAECLWVGVKAETLPHVVLGAEDDMIEHSMDYGRNLHVFIVSIFIVMSLV